MNMPILGYNILDVNRKVDRGATPIAHGLSKFCIGELTVNYSTLPLFARKVCNICGESKPLSEFHKGNGPDGLRQACKPCINAQNRGIYQKNHDSHLEAKRRYRRENPEARRATVIQHEERHAEKRAAYHAVWRAIKKGKMLPPSACRCARCQSPAEIYHHHSYEPQFWFDVTPLCRACHGEEHRAYAE